MHRQILCLQWCLPNLKTLHIIVLWMHSVQWQNGQWTHLACFWLYRSGIEWRQRLDFRSSLGLEHVENNHSGTWVPDFLKINLWQWIWRRTYREVPWRKFVKGKSTDQQMRELIQFIERFFMVFRQTPEISWASSTVASKKNCRLVQRSAKSALDSMTFLMLSSMPYGEITKQTSTTSLWTNESIRNHLADLAPQLFGAVTQVWSSLGGRAW